MRPTVKYPVIRTTVMGIEHFMNLRPAHITCDVCKDLFICHGHYWFTDRTRVTADLLDEGWLIIGDHEQHVCPECRHDG